MITVVIAFVAALIAMLLTIWDCDFKWVKIFLSIAAGEEAMKNLIDKLTSPTISN